MPNELLLTEPRSIAVSPYDEEPLAASEVRAEAIVSGISHGTELALYRGVSPFDGKRFDTDLRLFVEDAERAAYPMRLGYEWVGTVTETRRRGRHAVEVGDLVHLALPHRETQTLAVDDRPQAADAAAGRSRSRARRAPLVERRSRCRRSTTRASRPATPSPCSASAPSGCSPCSSRG